MAGPRRRADHPGRIVVAASDGGQIGRRGALLAAGVLVVAGLAAATAAAETATPAHLANATSTALQVTEVEYRLMLSEAVVKAGPVSLEALDAGMDPHDLRLRRGSTGAAFAVQTLAPGQRWDGTVDLRPGIYHLWCSLPGHWKLGMHATLRVVR